MRKLGKSYRLSADSTGEIVDEFRAAVARVGRDVPFAGRKLRAGPFLNAFAVWFLRLPEGERAALAAELVAELEGFLAETEEERARSRRPPGAGPVRWLPPKDRTGGDVARERERGRSDLDPDGDHERAEGDCEPRRV